MMSETIDFIDMVPEDLEIGGEPDYNDIEFYSLNEFMKTLPFDYFGDGSVTEPFISKKKTSIIDTIRKDILATKAGIPIGETAEVVYVSQGFTKSEKVHAFPKYKYYPNQDPKVLSSFDDVQIEGVETVKTNFNFVTDKLDNIDTIYSVKHGGTFPYLMNKSYAFSLKLELERTEYPVDHIGFKWKKKKELIDELSKSSDIQESIRTMLLEFCVNLQNCLERNHASNNEELVRIGRIELFYLQLEKLSYIYNWNFFDNLFCKKLLEPKKQELLERRWWDIDVERKIQDLVNVYSDDKKNSIEKIASSIYEFEKYNVKKLEEKSKELIDLRDSSWQLRVECENEIIKIAQKNDLIDKLELDFRTHHINGK